MATPSCEQFLANASTLYDHEIEALLSALRRDRARELDAAATDVRWAEWHQTNARHSLHLLEILNPKAPTPADRMPLAEPFTSTGHQHPLAEAAATAIVNAASSPAPAFPSSLDGHAPDSANIKSTANH